MTGQATKGKSKKKLVGIIVTCVIAISVVIVVTTHLPKVPSGGIAELEYVAVSAYDFAKELFDPELTSLQRDDLWKNYEGKQAEWTNELKYVSTKKEGLIAYFLNPLDWARTEVVAFFDESQMSSLLQLKEGDLVTYTGVLATLLYPYGGMSTLILTANEFWLGMKCSVLVQVHMTMLLNIAPVPLPKLQLSTEQRGSYCGKVSRQNPSWWELTPNTHTLGIRYVLFRCPSPMTPGIGMHLI
jgi:hypothetical protein